MHKIEIVIIYAVNLCIMGYKWYRSRQFLERNKVFFETVAAVLLSGMAIIVSILQLNMTTEQTSLIKKQTVIADKQTSLIEKQTVIADKQLALASEQLIQQGKQTLLTKIQTDIAKMQADLSKKQQGTQDKEAAISRAKDWAALRDLLRPIVEQYPIFGRGENPALKNLSPEEQLKWLSEMESLVSRLGTNPVLIDSRQNYERYLSMLAELEWAKTIEFGNNDFFYKATIRLGRYAMGMWKDLGMFRSSFPPEDKRYQATTPEESIYEKGFPWMEEIRKKK